MATFVQNCMGLFRDRRGVAAAEYAIMAVGIVIIVGVAVVSLADPNNSAFVILGNTVASTQTDMINNLATTR